MLGPIQQRLKDRSFDHYQSRQFLLDQKQELFNQSLLKMTREQKDWWFGGRTIKTLDDLKLVPYHTSSDILQAQLDNPPYGPLPTGQLMFSSSGSTGGRRPMFHYSWDNYLNLMWASSRWASAFNVGPNDTVMTLDVGATQSGYRRFEDMSSLIFGARMIKSGGTTWVQKLERMRDHDVTILIGNTEKLKRLAAHDPKQYLKPGQLRIVGQMGMPLTDEDYLKDSFGVDSITDLYGSAEIGSMYFRCPSGQTHFHDDLVHTIDHPDGTLFSNLYSIPIWNFLQAPGEHIKYSYKGTCSCGSNLPTVDYFKPRQLPNSNFIKE